MLTFFYLVFIFSLASIDPFAAKSAGKTFLSVLLDFHLVFIHENAEKLSVYSLLLVLQPRNVFTLYCWFFNHETYPKVYILARPLGKYPSRYEVAITLFKFGLILPKPVAPVGYSTAVIMFNLRSSISSPPHKNFCRC